MPECKSKKMSRNGFAEFDPVLFEAPPASTFPVYAWIWNAAISKSGIVTQLDEFSLAGIKGIYVLAEPKNFRPQKQRTMLEPDYFSDEYVELLAFAYRYAHEKGMALWLYDEGGWPSGGACGLVKKIYPDASAKVIASRDITLRTGDRYLLTSMLAAFIGSERLRGNFLAERETIITEYFVEAYEPNDNFVNLIDEKVVDTFLELDFSVYKQLGDIMDDVSLSFTDEPRLIMPAWKNDMDRLFGERFGYDMLDYLPVIVGNRPCETPEESKAVADYNDFCRDEFKRVFFDRYAKKCAEFGIYFSGHIDQDNTLLSGIRCGHADPLPLLRAMDIPGVDTIWRQIFPGLKFDRLHYEIDFFPRFASSAANQSGGQLALSESFSVYGDGLTPNQMRYVMNYQLVRGINVFNFMSLPYGKERGLALCMRPALCPEKPGFRNMRDFYCACARASYLMRIGKRVCETALYLPSEAVIAGESAVKPAYESFISIGRQLESECIDFDLIDAEAIRSGVEENGCLRVGGALYRSIIIPEHSLAPVDVIEKAAHFSGEVKPFAMSKNKNLRVAKRQSNSGRLYMIFNESTEFVCDDITINDSGQCYLLDIQNGFIKKTASDLRVNLESGEAAFVLFTDRNIRTVERKVVKLKLSSLIFVSARRFVITYDGISSRAADESEIDHDFSGEVSYRLEYESQDSTVGKVGLIELDIPGCTARVTIDDSVVATAAETPQRLYIDNPSERGELILTIANNSVNEIAAKEATVFRKWDDVDYALYHKKAIVFEKESVFTLPDMKEIYKK